MTINVTSTGFSLKGGNGSSTPQTASPVTIKLKTGTQVTGQLVKSDGSTGVANAWVDFWDPSTYTSTGGASTDASGEFSIVLPSGDYNVNLYIPSDVGEATPAGMTISVTSTGFSLKGGNGSSTPQTTSPVTIKLKTGTQVTGKVVKTDGTTGVANAWVDFWDPNTYAGAGGAPTDGSGEFSIILPSGDYNVNLYIPSDVGEATPAGMTISVTSTGFSLKGGNGSSTPQTASPVTIKLLSGSNVSGSVRDPNSNGVNNVYVQFTNTSTGKSAGVSTDPVGSYSITLQNATYDISFYLPASVTYASPLGQSITVSGASVTKNFSLSNGTTVSGTVKDSSSEGVTNAYVSFTKNGQTVGTSVTPSGAFTITLGDGSYSVSVTPPPVTGLSSVSGQSLTVSNSTFSPSPFCNYDALDFEYPHKLGWPLAATCRG